MELRLKNEVKAALFPLLAAAVMVSGNEEHPEGVSNVVCRGEVTTVTARGAMLSTASGSRWVSSPAVCSTALRGDSLLVLGSENGRFIAPLSIRHKPSGSPVRFFRASFRSLLIKRIADNKARGLAGGLLMGLRGMITEETAQVFRNSGTSHLLALSGLHTATAAAVMMLLSSLIFGRRPVSSILAVTGIVLFVLLSGTRPSTVRAGIMSVCAVLWISRKGGRADILSFWWLALGLSILLVPETLSDRGAWMSYGAVLSLILFGKNFRGKAGFFLSPLFAGVTVTVALAPLTTSMYGGFAWLGPIATLVSLPLMTAVMFLGAASASGIPWASPALSAVSDFWHGLLGLFSHSPVNLKWNHLWLLWISALVLLRIFSRWNGFHRRFR